MQNIDLEKEELVSRLKGSLLEFTKFFFLHINGREFSVSAPVGRESHHITICRELTRAFRLEIPNHRLLIAVPPGHAKSTLLCMWVCYAIAHYPDCRFIYISYSQSLATRHTDFIKRIISSRIFGYLFGVYLRTDSKAKDNFMTTAGGAISAFGSASSIVGVDAGYPNLERFSGAVIMDDMHKIEEAHSDNIRQGVIDNYSQTIQQRPRGINVPIISIGQRCHEQDLAQHLIDGKDGYEWTKVILQALDSSNNALYPEAFPKEMLLIRKETDPYTFSAQFMQQPIPSGGSLFKPEWFVIMDKEPELIATLITVDSAETDKSWNDATAMGFYGLYELQIMGRKTEIFCLHWLDQIEIRVEPKDLKEAFLDFYANCSLHKNPPLLGVIEKKSSGVTLFSVLRDMRGMQIRAIDRTAASGSKTQRMLECQPIIASRRISFTEGAKHIKLCVDHMSKLTANNSHRFDDIFDSLEMAIRIALIEKTMYAIDKQTESRKQILTGMNQSFQKKVKLGAARNAGQSTY